MKINRIIPIFILAASLAGCFPAPVIFAGLAGGGVYSVTNDTISDAFAMPKEKAFETMVNILTEQDAKITSSSIADGKITASLNKSVIYVRIDQYNADSVKLTINAKKEVELIPDRDLAVRIYRLFIKETVK